MINLLNTYQELIYMIDNSTIKKEIENNKLSIDNLKNEQTNSNKIDNKILEKHINEFLSLENPTRELIINLVEKIYIYQDKTIDIIFTFKNRVFYFKYKYPIYPFFLFNSWLYYIICKFFFIHS